MSAARKIARQMARSPGNGLAPPDDLVQLKAWQYEASIQTQLWLQRAQQLHASIVEREGQPQPKVLAPPEPT